MIGVRTTPMQKAASESEVGRSEQVHRKEICRIILLQLIPTWKEGGRGQKFPPSSIVCRTLEIEIPPPSCSSPFYKIMSSTNQMIPLLIRYYPVLEWLHYPPFNNISHTLFLLALASGQPIKSDTAQYHSICHKPSTKSSCGNISGLFEPCRIFSTLACPAFHLDFLHFHHLIGRRRKWTCDRGGWYSHGEQQK